MCLNNELLLACQSWAPRWPFSPPVLFRDLILPGDDGPRNSILSEYLGCGKNLVFPFLTQTQCFWLFGPSSLEMLLLLSLLRLPAPPQRPTHFFFFFFAFFFFCFKSPFCVQSTYGFPPFPRFLASLFVDAKIFQCPSILPYHPFDACQPINLNFFLVSPLFF